MKLIEARYEDICMKCAGKINVGEFIFWEKKNSRHARCVDSVISRWLRND